MNSARAIKPMLLMVDCAICHNMLAVPTFLIGNVKLVYFCYTFVQFVTGLGLLPPTTQWLGLPTFNERGVLTTSVVVPKSSPVVLSSPPMLSVEPNMGNFQDLPPKLVKRILNLEFVDISELISESWKVEEEAASSSCCQHPRAPRRGPVTDILLWIECYSTLVSVLASRFPTKVPQLMSYQKTVVKAHRTYAGQGWVTYDIAYRRRAANTKSLEWGVIDFNLCNETFAGQAKAIPRCKFCSSELHSSDDCVHAYSLVQFDVQSSNRRFPSKLPGKLLPYVSNSTVTIKITAS